MTDAAHDNAGAPDAKVAPETLELRTRPQPVTRTNRKVLIGGAAVVLTLISGLVLVALRPPTLHGLKPEELINVEHKPITDRLAIRCCRNRSEARCSRPRTMVLCGSSGGGSTRKRANGYQCSQGA